MHSTVNEKKPHFTQGQILHASHFLCFFSKFFQTIATVNANRIAFSVLENFLFSVQVFYRDFIGGFDFLNFMTPSYLTLVNEFHMWFNEYAYFSLLLLMHCTMTGENFKYYCVPLKLLNQKKKNGIRKYYNHI